MDSALEEKLREAASLGDLKILRTLLKQNVNINSQNSVNGWTALHWACKRGHEGVVQLLLANGASPKICNNKGEAPGDVTSSSSLLNLLGCTDMTKRSKSSQEQHFLPNYMTNAPLNVDFDMETSSRKTYNTTKNKIYSTQYGNNNNLVLRIRIAGSSDPDFIEVEIPPEKLYYSPLLNICCAELTVKESLVERIRKLPNTRLRNDSDIKRLKYLDSLELVLRDPHLKTHPNYPLVSTCKNEKILY